MLDELPMEALAGQIEFERQGRLRRLVKAVVVNPLANYLPARVMKALLRFGKSELAESNWSDPGGWRSMVISYDGKCRQLADKMLVSGGSMSKALRNRRRLAAGLLARLIDQSPDQDVHVLCLGAGPGRIIMDAMLQADSDSSATLVDLSSDAFEHGRRQADQENLADRIRFIQGDVRDVGGMLDRPPDVVKMLGICEYLSDSQIVDIGAAVRAVMPDGAPIVFNSISRAHGNDRFFRRVFGLHMIHRTPHDLQQIMQEAGFGDFVSIPEPLGVYHVIVGRKFSESAEARAEGVSKGSA